MYVQATLNFLDKVNLVMVDGLDVCLFSIFWYFIKDFCVNARGYCLHGFAVLVLFVCMPVYLFTWFEY